jgi:hypothetical protein
MQSVKNSNQDNDKPKKKLNAYSLAGLGIGGIKKAGTIVGSRFFVATFVI